MNNFLILGLPRSRTAWLANFMTYDGHYCSHEGLDGCESLYEYKSKFYPFSGDSNTGLALLHFEPMFKDFKVVVIDNEIDEAVKFSSRYYQYDATEIMTRLKIRLDSIEGLHINFNDINDRLAEIWMHVSKQPFDEHRADMLKDFNVQIMDPYDYDIRAMEVLINNHDYFSKNQERC
jgi:hypothetical protein